MVKRFKHHGYGELCEEDDGEYVLHADHEAKLADSTSWRIEGASRTERVIDENDLLRSRVRDLEAAVEILINALDSPYCEKAVRRALMIGRSCVSEGGTSTKEAWDKLTTRTSSDVKT